MQTNPENIESLSKVTPKSALEFAKDSAALQMILDRSMGLVCTIDRNGIFADVSKECESMFGYQRSDMLGKYCFDFIVDDDRERTKNEFARVLTSNEVVDCENRFRHASSEIIDLRWSARWDRQNNLLYCVVHNVTEHKRTERALHQTAQNYRALFHSSPIPKWIYNQSTHRIVEVNRKAVSHYGFTTQEFLEKRITDLLISDEIQRGLDAHEGITPESEAKYVGKFTHVKSNGDSIRVELYCHGTQFNDTDCITVTSIDVSEREHSLAQLQESIQRYEFVTKATYDVVWDWDLAENRMYRGEGIYALFGYASDELTPDFKAWEKYVHPSDRERVEAGIKLAMHSENNIWRDEYRFKRSDGTYALILDRGLVIRDSSGKAIRMVGAMQDITRQKDEEQRLRLLESVITNTNDAVIIAQVSPIDEPGPAIVYVNEAFTRMTGYESDEVVGRSPRFLQGPNSNAAMLHELGEAMRRFQTYEVETINYKKSGEEFWINFSVSPVADQNGTFTHFIAIERDVTERKRGELMSALLADMAVIFDKSHSLSVTLSEALSRLSQFGEFDLAEAWLVDSDKERIVLSGYCKQSAVMEEFYRVTADTVSFDRGVGLPGMTWNKGEIQTRKVGKNVVGLTRIDAFRDAGLTTLYGLPLRHHNETIGVLVLGSSAERDSKHKLGDFLAGFEEQFCAEIQRKQLEEELQLLFNFAPAIICIMGTDGYYRRVNPIMCEILGYSEAELLGNPAIAFVHPDDRELTISELNSVSAGTTSHYFESRHITKSSEVKWLGWTVSPAKKDGNIFAVAKDITERKKLENLLRLSTNMARVGSWELDLVKGQLWWSAMSRKIHEVDSAFEPQVGTALSFYIDEDLPIITDLVDKTVRNGDPFDAELRIRTALGNVRWVRTMGNCEFLDGRCIKIVGSIQDIHEKKLAQEAVVHTLNEKNIVLESISDGFITLDHNWIVTFWNPAASYMLGKSREEALGRNVWEVFDDAVDTDFFTNFRKAVAENIAVHFEEYYPKVDKWFSIDAYPSAAGLAIYFRDITLRRQADERLRMSNEMFKRVSQATNDAIWDWNIETDQLQWGDGMRSVFGHEYFDGLTTFSSCIENIHSDDFDAVVRSMDEILSDPARNRWQFDYRYRRADGSWAYVVDVGSVIRDRNGKAVRMVGAMQDITHRKEYEESLKLLNIGLKKGLEELERSNKELEQFAYVASHDLQEPLRMVTSFLSQLEHKYHDQLDEKAHTYIHYATDGAKRMRQIILDLLEYSRAGRSEGTTELVNTDTVIIDIVSLLERKIEETGASVTWDSLPTIKTQKVPLRQLFQNLISNALTYQATGNKPIIKISAIEQETQWQFSVADNGIGISTEYFERVFQIFQRLHSQDEFAGTGMGLAICKKIVDSLGGVIWLESNIGLGTTFYFTIPKNRPTHEIG